jgi:hypothetical protein
MKANNRIYQLALNSKNTFIILNQLVFYCFLVFFGFCVDEDAQVYGLDQHFWQKTGLSALGCEKLLRILCRIHCRRLHMCGVHGRL